MRALVAILLVTRTAAADCVAGDAQAESAQIGSAAAVVCYDRCWRLDYATLQWTVVDKPAPIPDAPPPPGPKITLASKLHVCSPDCHDITVPGVAAITERDVVENGDRSLLAVIGPYGDKHHPVHVFDAVTGKLLSTIQAWKTGMGDPPTFQRVAFLGDTLFVAVSDTPVTSVGRLYGPRSGHQLAEVGGKHAAIDDSVTIDLGGNRWAFQAFDSNELIVHDVATGKQLPSIRSGPKGGYYRALQRIGNRVVGVRDHASAGVMLYDVDKRITSHYTVPACK